MDQVKHHGSLCEGKTNRATRNLMNLNLLTDSSLCGILCFNL